MQGQWFYGAIDQRRGPVPVQELQRLVASGQISPQTMVWSEGMPEWVPAIQLPFLRAAGVDPSNSPGLNLLIPIGPQSGLAIAAGYLGLVGFLFAPLGVLGILFGVLGLRDLKAHPEKRGTGRAITGIVGGALGALLWAFILTRA